MGLLSATKSQQDSQHDSQQERRQEQQRARGASLIRSGRRSLMHELASRGVRMTAQRRVLIRTIQQASAHLDAAALLRLAKGQDPNIDRATVYRTLALLKNLGLIDELDLMHLEGEKHYYEARTSREHCHLACLRCGAILEYSSPAFEALAQEIATQNGFQVKVIRLEVGGVCKRCRQSDETAHER